MVADQTATMFFFFFSLHFMHHGRRERMRDAKRREREGYQGLVYRLEAKTSDPIGSVKLLIEQKAVRS